MITERPDGVLKALQVELHSALLWEGRVDGLDSTDRPVRLSGGRCRQCEVAG